MVVLNNQYLPPKSLASIILKQRVKWVNTVNVVPSGSRKLLKLPWRGTVRFLHASFKIKRRIKWFSIICILWRDTLMLCSILWVFCSLSPLHIVGYHFVLFWAWKNHSTLFPLILCCSLILYLWHHFASLLMAACMCTRCMSVCIEDFLAGSLVHMGPFDLTVLDIINNILYHQHIVRHDKVRTSSCMVTLTSYMMLS